MQAGGRILCDPVFFSPPLHLTMASFRNFVRWLRRLVGNRYVWGGLGVLFIIGLAGYFLFNHIVFPSYTRHGVAVTVPDVMNQPVAEAVRMLEAGDFRVEQNPPRFNPQIERDVILEQIPKAGAEVKPGRRVFLTVNSGRPKMVPIPDLVREGASLREAVSQLSARGLQVQVVADSVPSPYPNTVTRQRPAAGDSVQVGGEVTLWYSTGLGEQYVTLPDLVGLPVNEARARLDANRLRFLIFREQEDGDATTDIDDDELRDLVVVRQSREAGTRVREGFELRLFVDDEAEGSDRFF